MTWDYKQGTGIWAEYVNSDTGESTLKQHELKVVKQWCSDADHTYELLDAGKRLIQCITCGQERTFVVGLEDFKDGKIIKR